MKHGAAGSCREQALSEVIGFVLIIGIIMVAFSLYLVYGVPVQGRENEINHMSTINDQFVSYKIGIDSLVTNQQKGLAMSTTFPLGTAAQTSQGSTSIIPIMQPIGSSGVLAINQRTITPEIFTVSSNSYITNTTAITSVGPIPIPTTQTYSNAPSSLLINMMTINAFWNITSTGGTPGSVAIIGSGWNVTVNVTPDIADCLSYSTFPNGTVNTTTLAGNCNGSDLTITVVKNGITSLNRAVVDSNINPNIPYSINLLDPAYGLQSVITYPATITFSTTGNPVLTSPNVTAQYAYQQQSNYTYSVPLGSLEYSTNNNYWIPQSYYYSDGRGVPLPDRRDHVQTSPRDDIRQQRERKHYRERRSTRIRSFRLWFDRWQQPGTGIDILGIQFRQPAVRTCQSQYMECKHQYHNT